MSKNLWGSKNKSIMWQEKSLNVKEESQMVMNKVLLWKQSVNITGTWNTYRIMASFKKYIYYKEKAAMLQEKKTVGPTFMLSASLVQSFFGCFPCRAQVKGDIDTIVGVNAANLFVIQQKRLPSFLLNSSETQARGIHGI